MKSFLKFINYTNILLEEGGAAAVSSSFFSPGGFESPLGGSI